MLSAAEARLLNNPNKLSRHQKFSNISKLSNPNQLMGRNPKRLADINVYTLTILGPTSLDMLGGLLKQ